LPVYLLPPSSRPNAWRFGRNFRLDEAINYLRHAPVSKLPLVLVDFRGELKERRREVTQRSVSELTSGVLGFSHFTNWYFYVASDFSVSSSKS
jgi:hypothetical protein